MWMQTILKKASEILPDARTYTDWRELLKKEGDKIDSVNVTVPDHNHFSIAYQAIQGRKHVYCQKPMCHDVAEVRVLTEAAVRAGVITQLGTQIASSIGDRTAVQLIKEGAIGKVKHAYLCSNRPGAEKYRLLGPRPAEGQEHHKILTGRSGSGVLLCARTCRKFIIRLTGEHGRISELVGQAISLSYI